MQWREVEPDVFYGDGPLVTATAADLRLLESHAQKSPRRRARLCAHPEPCDRLHEMLICLARDGYIRPHRHFKTESALILRGACDLVLFDEQGGIQEVLPLGDAGQGQAFFMRLTDPVFHTYLLRTEFLVFLETTPGPLDRSLTEQAPWAPEETGQVESYQRDLQARVASWRHRRPESGGRGHLT